MSNHLLLAWATVTTLGPVLIVAFLALRAYRRSRPDRFVVWMDGESASARVLTRWGLVFFHYRHRSRSSELYFCPVDDFLLKHITASQIAEGYERMRDAVGAPTLAG